MVLPLDVLQKSLEKRMVLLLKDGRTLEGQFMGYDQYMNLVLDEAEEKSDSGERRLGTVILRGNNVVSMSVSES